MPTANTPCVDALYDPKLFVALFLLLGARFKKAKLPENRFGLFRVCLQRHMSLLHSILLEKLVGSKNADNYLHRIIPMPLIIVKWGEMEILVARSPFFCYIYSRFC